MVAVSTSAMASSLLLRPRASFLRTLPPPPPPSSSRRALPATRLQAASTHQKETGLSASATSEGEPRRPAVTRLYSLAPYPLLLAALLPGAEPVTAVFAPFVELVKTWDLPGWLVHWGTPATWLWFYLQWAATGHTSASGSNYQMIQEGQGQRSPPKAPRFFFFALGATGGVTALLTSDKPIFESPHAVTGVIGLALLTIQAILPKLFEGNPGLRTTHGLLGSGIMTLFLIHAAFGLQLGLSF
ncbi:unnamed protein product [Urochloa humidicola]